MMDESTDESRDKCIFCRIADGALPSDQVYADDHAVAFRDLNPQAPTHILVIPRRHVASVAELADEDAELAGHLVLTASRIARDEGIEEAGYRLVANTGEEGGQSVDHLHLHLLGGRSMRWPPG